jgi:hypothetical protein
MPVPTYSGRVGVSGSGSKDRKATVVCSCRPSGCYACESGNIGRRRAITLKSIKKNIKMLIMVSKKYVYLLIKISIKWII